MLDTLLQVVGAIFYLLNKIFLSVSERRLGALRRQWRIWSWQVFLLGLIPWIVIFCYRHNWIAAAVEAAGAPGMIYGLVVASRGQDKKPQWLNRMACWVTLLGISYSLWSFRGLRQFNQVLELGIAVGFLVGIYEQANERSSGYLWFILMNASNAWLMGREHCFILMLQQIVSIGFVLDAWLIARRRPSQHTSVRETFLDGLFKDGID